ncbi:hypothetical protein Btru_044008 [Bulinus truncatus]|nr:hypothetical protein Btru_044008 [Bulinus truncatus]
MDNISTIFSKSSHFIDKENPIVACAISIIIKTITFPLKTFFSCTIKKKIFPKSEMEAQSIISKRSYSVLNAAQRSEENDFEEPPVKKKLRTKLVDLFNRASVCLLKQPEDRMKIYLRIKPFTANEDSSQKCFAVFPDENTVLATAPSSSHAHKSMKRGVGKSSQKFTFSKIFNEDTSQTQFFNETMLDMTKDFIAGQNSLVFTYGVTSSGKTYTIQGQPQDAGILPRCLDVIFNSINGKQIPSLTLKPKMFTDVVRLSPEEMALEKRIKDKTLRLSASEDTAVKTLLGEEMESALSDTALSSMSESAHDCGEEILKDVENRARELIRVEVEDQGKILFGVWVSFAEIYNENIFDLLEPMPSKKNAKRQGLKICDDKNGNPYIKGLKEINVESADEAYKLLTIGQRNLQTACTKLNHCSSRSHCIFNIKVVRITDKDYPHIARVNMLSLCDLAGSERYSKTLATGDRLKEAGNINSSLMTLSRCIETLRHNQMHRDKPRLVPFRESKLTRLLQNFFNGSGRAAMIVNVSQCPQMFDDTLHVFQFSAIAKQVKYVEQPIIETAKVTKEKKIPSGERGSIPWESPEKAYQESQIDLMTENDEEDEDEDSEENQGDSIQIKHLTAYIKAIETRNEKLVELLEEEINASDELENRVRKEVTQALMKQVVNIEETYSTMLKETREEGQELADERVRGIMAVYEEKLERIQKKVDEDDEWVSSLLYHQEKIQVQEREAKINELQKEILRLQKELKSKKSCDHSSMELGNSVLIETLSLKLQDSLDNCKMKDEKINELESLIAEAGEDYGKHVTEISQLKETIDQQKKLLEQKISEVEDISKKLFEKDELVRTMQSKEKELKSLEDDLLKKIRVKDSTIASLEEEIKEMHDEIEKLQDQMSLIDEQSKHNKSELESSLFSEKSKSTGYCSEHFKSLKNIESEVQEVNSVALEQKAELLMKACNDKDDELCNLTKVNTEHQEKIKALILENEILTKNDKTFSENMEILKKENTNLLNEIDLLKTANKELKKQHELPSNANENPDQQNSDMTVNNTLSEVNITDMVRQLEGTPSIETKLSVSGVNKSVGKIKEWPAERNTELLQKLKNAELANNALRSKLKKEEDDFFQREQALIHGYTAEIDTLKYELAKLKSKTDMPRIRSLRGKRKAAGTDVSVCSLASESLCDSNESGIDIVNKDDEHFDTDKHSSAVLSDELSNVYIQLQSLNAAYRTLQSVKTRGKKSNAFIQDVVLGTPKSRPSTFGIFRSEENVADSLLQFEIEEYVIKMEDLKMKINQQEQEIKECNKALNHEKVISIEKKEHLEEQKRCLEETNKKLEVEKTSLNMQLMECKECLEKNKLEIEKLIEQQNAFQIIIIDKEEAEKLLEKEKNLCSELQTQLDNLTTSSKELEDKHKLLISQMQNDLEKSQSVNSETETKWKLLIEDEKNTRILLHKTKEENSLLIEQIEENKLKHQELQNVIDELNADNRKLLDTEQSLKETKEKLNIMQVSRDDIEKELTELKTSLANKEEQIKRLEKQSDCLQNQQEESSNEKKSLFDIISNLEKQVGDAKLELLSKNKEIETLKGNYQEETAEVAQKLLAMEREKRLAERKATEAKEKEEECRIKCQGLEKMKQLEEQLHEQLKDASRTLKKQREDAVALKKNAVALKEELAAKNEELKKLQEEKDKVKTRDEQHRLKIKEIEEKFNLEKENMKKQFTEQNDCLKKGLSEAEGVMMKLEQIISKQDEDIANLSAEIDNLCNTKEKLEQTILSNNMEILHLKKQLSNLEEELRHPEVEQKERISQEQMQKMSWEKGALKEKFQNLEKEKLLLEEKIESLEKLLKCEKENVDKKLELTEKLKNNAEENLKGVSKEHDLLKEKLEIMVKEKSQASEKISRLESEILQFKNEANNENSQSSKQRNIIEDLEKTNKQLRDEIEKLHQDINTKQDTLKEENTIKQNLNKEVQKLHRLNERNREEMENWKKEKDTCVSQLELLINKRQNENKSLSQEIEQLKADNALLVKQIESNTSMKDAVIADLKKSNNTLSIELSKLQGISPPPVMMSPGNFLTKREFIEDLDTTGHLEVDATPPIAAKKTKKHGSLKLLQNNLLSSIDSDSLTPIKKSLKTIEEQENEMSPCTATGKVAEIATEIISNLTPLTRSARKKDKESKKIMKKLLSSESELTPSMKEETENLNPCGTRRSSRLKCRTKQSAV